MADQLTPLDAFSLEIEEQDEASQIGRAMSSVLLEGIAGLEAAARRSWADTPLAVRRRR